MEHSMDVCDKIIRPDKEDDAREAVAQLITKLAPKQSPMDMPEAAFNATYVTGRRVAVGMQMLRASEAANGVLYCRMCLEKRQHDIVSAATLHVSYEENVLRTSSKMAHAVCHQCHFEIHVPVDARTGTQPSDDDMKMARMEVGNHISMSNFPRAIELAIARGLPRQDIETIEELYREAKRRQSEAQRQYHKPWGFYNAKQDYMIKPRT